MAKRQHHQTNGPPPRKLSQIMNAERREGLLEFGAPHPFVLKKQHFLGHGEEAASPDERSNAKQTEPNHERGHAARPPGVCGLSLRLDTNKMSFVLV